MGLRQYLRDYWETKKIEAEAVIAMAESRRARKKSEKARGEIQEVVDDAERRP